MFTEINSITQVENSSWIKLAGKVSQFLTGFVNICDFPSQNFRWCEPEIVCMDGIVLSIQYKRIIQQTLEFPWLPYS
jgi:hypothetical protein